MRRRHYLLASVAAIALAALVAIVYAGQRIEKAARPRLSLEIEDLPHRRVGLVLGCSPMLQSGEPNQFFVNRIDAAVAVFKAHKVDYLLVSGDNHFANYDEPTAMKNALVRLGVPEDRIVLDYAGFSTLDSVVRAKKVFGLSDFCIISQRDHALRAIYIARSNGIDAVAFPAKDVSTLGGLRTRIRESLARVRTLLDVHLIGRTPHFLGEPIEIGTSSKSTLDAEKV